MHEKHKHHIDGIKHHLAALSKMSHEHQKGQDHKKHHESKKTAQKKEHMGMEKYERGPVKHHKKTK